MPTLYKRLTARLPAAKFYPPAAREQIARIERALGTRFPKWLRDLYLCCNGIRPADMCGPYLYALERRDDFRESLLSWNQFHRRLWLDNIAAYKRNRPEIEWDLYDPGKLLIIGTDEDEEWAIRTDAGMEIIRYDVRNPECPEIIGADLLEACLNREDRLNDVNEDLFRGRELYRNETGERPAACDVERLFDTIVHIHRWRDPTPGVKVSTGWALFRAISQREGEAGQLFILRIGIDEQVRIVTRDGNVPFSMHLRAWPGKEDLRCIVTCLAEALSRILTATEAVRLPWLDGKRPCPDELLLRQVWRNAVNGRHAELSRMAEILCARDDRRRSEKNELGGYRRR